MNRVQTIDYTIAAIALFTICHTALLAEPQEKPRLHVESETVQFGRVIVGSKVMVQFNIQNTGDARLLLYDVEASCADCTTILSNPDKLEPGQTGVIRAMVLTAELRGDVDRTLSVYSNDPVGSRRILHMTGHVWSPLELKPHYIYFPTLKSVGIQQEYRVDISNTTNQDILLSNARSSDKRFRAKLISSPKNKKYTLVVTTVPPLDYGSNRGVISFETNYPGLPTVEMRATANVTPPLTFSPSKIFLKAGKLEKSTRKNVKLSSRLSPPAQILNHVLSITGPSVEIVERKPGHYVQYSILFPKGFIVESGLNGSLSVRTDHEQFREISLPIRSYSNIPTNKNAP